MSKQFGISSLLASAASFLVIGMVAVGTPAQAASEEDLAAPHGSFVSTLAMPDDRGNVTYVIRDNRPAIVTASEEDLAAPHGSFTSAMVAPEIHRAVKLAGDPHRLAQIVAAGLE